MKLFGLYLFLDSPDSSDLNQEIISSTQEIFSDESARDKRFEQLDDIIAQVDSIYKREFSETSELLVKKFEVTLDNIAPKIPEYLVDQFEDMDLDVNQIKVN